MSEGKTFRGGGSPTVGLLLYPIHFASLLARLSSLSCRVYFHWRPIRHGRI